MTADNDALRRAIGGVLFNVMNFPPSVQARLLRQDMTPLNAKLTEAVLASDWLREVKAAAWQVGKDSRPEPRDEDGTTLWYWDNPYEKEQA